MSYPARVEGLVNSISHSILPRRLGARKKRLQLFKGVRLPQRLPWIRHYTIWWWDSSNAGALENAEYSPLPGPLWLGEVTPDEVKSIGKKGLQRLIMLNWIVWIDFFLHLIECKPKKSSLKWIVWNITVKMYKNRFGVELLFIFHCILPSRLGAQKKKPTSTHQRGKTTPNDCPGYDTMVRLQ